MHCLTRLCSPGESRISSLDVALAMSHISSLDVALAMTVLNSNNIVYVCLLDLEIIYLDVIAYVHIDVMSEAKDKI